MKVETTVNPKSFDDCLKLKGIAEDLLDQVRSIQIGKVIIDQDRFVFHARQEEKALRVELTRDGKFYVKAGQEQIAHGWFEGSKVVWASGEPWRRKRVRGDE